MSLKYEELEIKEPSIALMRICQQAMDSIKRNDARELALCLTDAWLLIKMETNQGDNDEN